MSECELQALIAAAEAATEETQHIVIYDALVYAHKQGWISDGPYDLAMRWRGAGAFTDAALQLVPKGWKYDLSTVGENWAHVRLWLPVVQYGKVTGYKPAKVSAESITPALAFCIAALKARQASEAREGGE